MRGGFCGEEVCSGGIAGGDVDCAQAVGESEGDIGVCLSGEVGIRTFEPAGVAGIGCSAEVRAEVCLARDWGAGVEGEEVCICEVEGDDGGEAANGRVDAEDEREVSTEGGGKGAGVDVPESTFEADDCEVVRLEVGLGGEPFAEVGEVGLLGVLGAGVHAAGSWEVVARQGRSEEFRVMGVGSVDFHLPTRV